MARMQRWKRSRSAGEGTGPDAEVDETAVEQVDQVDEEVELVEEPEEPAAPDDLDGYDDGEAALDEELATDLDPDTDLDEDLDDGPDDDGLDDDGPDEDLDADDDELDEDELDELPEDGRPLLPSATESRFGGGLLAVQLLQAAHAKQAITTALALALAAAVSGRPARETAVVLLTVLVGQTILGWHNDIVDRQRDQAHGLTGKPVAMGRISTETLWYALFVAALLLVPLAITTGIKAGCLYLASVAVGLLGNVVLRTGFFSWWSWAASYALLPAYLSFGGWGGQAEGNPPEPSIVALAALLGIGVHFMRAVWGLVADHEDGWTYLPLKLGLKLGATRLLALSTVYTAIIAILIAVMGAKVGLSK